MAETVDEYRAALAETAQAADAALSSLPAGTSLASDPQLDQALQRLAAISQVTAGDVTVSIDNRGLIRSFRGTQEQGRQALASLKALIAASDAQESKAGTDGAKARAALDVVLARPEFQPSSGGIGRALQDLRERFIRWLDSLFPGFRLPALPNLNLPDPSELIFWLAAGVFITFAAIILIYTWYNARHGLTRSAALKAGSRPEAQDAQSARLAAQQAADQGDYRLAVHYLYLWAVLHLAEGARLRFDRSLTNHELVQAVAANVGIARLLQPAVDDFDRIWYGHAACTVAEYSQFRATVQRIVEATP